MRPEAAGPRVGRGFGQRLPAQRPHSPQRDQGEQRPGAEFFRLRTRGVRVWGGGGGLGFYTWLGLVFEVRGYLPHFWFWAGIQVPKPPIIHQFVLGCSAKLQTNNEVSTLNRRHDLFSFTVGWEARKVKVLNCRFWDMPCFKFPSIGGLGGWFGDLSPWFLFGA